MTRRRMQEYAASRRRDMRAACGVVFLVVVAVSTLCGCRAGVERSSANAIGKRTFNSETGDGGTDAANGEIFVATQKYSVPCTVVKSSVPIEDGGPTAWEGATVYEHDENGRKTSMDTGINVTVYSYDEDGRLIREENFPSPRSSNPGAPYRRVVEYFYDETGNLIREEEDGDYGSSTTTYDYDETGLLIVERESRQSIGGGGSSEKAYTYDSDGKLTSTYEEQLGSSRGGTSWGATTIWYDERGNEIVSKGVSGRNEDEVVNGNGDEGETRWKYIYDDNGNLVSKSQKHAQTRWHHYGEGPDLQAYYDYDKYGNLLRVQEKHPTYRYSETYSYECWRE